MHAYEMTLAYLRGGLSTCSVVWVYFSVLFPKVYKNFDATVQKFPLELEKLRLIPSFSRAVYACATLFLNFASVALVRDFKFWCKNDDFSCDFVNF